MALENAHLEDSSEFEPDSNFFDNFLDGMDVLIDNARDPKDEQSWMDGKTDDESDCSSGEDRMVIDLPSSPERPKNTKEVKSGERSDIKDVLTSRVLAQLEKSSSNRRNKVKNSFPSSQLVVDVLDRIKKSVQQKTNAPFPSSSTTLYPDVSKNNLSTPVPKTGESALQVKLQGGILSNLSTEPDEQNGKKTMSQIFRWSFSEKTSRYEHSPLSDSGHGAKIYEDENSNLNKNRRKRRKHKKHKSSKPNNKEHSRRHRHHRTKSKKVRMAKDVEEAKTSDFSLESVSSEDEDDILNKQHTDEEEVVGSGEADDCGMAKSLKCREYFKRPDCEEGEVLSSSSEWESECVAKKRRRDLKFHQIRPECLSPSSTDGPRSRRYEHRRVSTPPSPPWPGVRLRAEDHGRYILRRTRSPVRMSPWREQPNDRQRLRIPIPRLESLSPVPIPVSLRPRSPGDRLASELPRPYVDSYCYPIETLTSRRVEHVMHPFHRPRSPWEEVHESRHLFKSSTPMEIHPREAPCPALRIERRYPREPGNERRNKPGVLSRCLQEIRYRSCKPGRFVYDPKLEAPNSTQSSRPIGRYSSPLYPSQPQSSALSFTAPSVRHIGTSSSSLGTAFATISVGCQTLREEISNITVEQVKKSAEITDKSRLTNHGPQSSCASVPSSAVSEIFEVTGATRSKYRPPAQSNTERQNIIQEIVSQVSVAKTTSCPTSSQGTLEMWKTIVSFRYPDLSEKEREQVVLVKSMESTTNNKTETA